MNVIWREEARDDIFRIAHYIAEENPLAARQVARELFLVGESLSVFPRRGRIGRVRGTRELVIFRPYIVVYEMVAANVVHILRVWHGAQHREG